MNPSPQQIVDSPAWKELSQRLSDAIAEQFLLVPASDPQALQLIRLRFDALRSILAEMAAMARAETR